ncbi:CCR4-NOT transcription complex subunit 10 [Gracilariopsis chorda]|uniref:CCR4-NOT transcription complex subunit 10 n=1 Tax=Gracilariopsis chorda TaxID=448386 RepID=A0A2V3J566_9FLOR|nr:CCR4-NOT transcription complex subunit 10 [Gracilariopsis chorda]|eukprot:PXF49262.1 CCR4-NOT transcription complex subunit 10 [Gracilariopsis chorda]
MAADALTAFLLRDFAAASQALLSLSDSPKANGNSKTPPEDPRIRHNLLVSEFYHNNSFQAIDDLVLFITHTLPQETKPTSANNLFSSITDNALVLKPLLSKFGPIALYNLAVIAYHFGFLQSASTIGDVLYANIEAMDDWLALRTCFLLIDLHLRLNDLPFASKISAYSEKLLPSFSSRQDGSGTPSEIKVLTPEWPTRSKCILEQPASYEDAKFCMHIYNARISSAFDESADGLRTVRKEAKSAVLVADDSHTRPTAAALLVKARVEPSYHKGLRILASVVGQSSSTMIQNIRPLALNSLGVLHHRLGCHALAACYFEHSRQAFRKLFSEEGRNAKNPHAVHLTSLSTVHNTHVAYNLALQYMQLSDFSKALDSFMICVKNDFTYANTSPLLWIRIAECCIGIERNSGRPLLAVEGQGRGRRFIMRAAERDEGLNMEYAATCARAAIAILDRRKNRPDGQVSPSRPKRASLISNSSTLLENTPRNSTTPSQDASEDNRLRGAALALLAYSSLSFDPKAAVEACREIQTLYPNGNNDRCILSRLYAAEAYCMLNRPSDAANQLYPLVHSIISDSAAKEAVHINWALTQACRGDIATASKAARTALKGFSVMSASQQRHRSLHRDTIFAASYIFLRNRETEIARRCLRSLLGSA